MKLDILAFGSHPDDVELSCAGVLIRHASSGKKVGIVDLTRGELGTRGSASIRLKEAEASRKVIGAAVRDNLGMADGFFTHDKKNILKVIRKIRQYRPDIVICNAPFDRHPDHGRGARLVNDACFLSGLLKIRTSLRGKPQQHFRPRAVYHYVQFKYLKPDHVVDISAQFEQKMKAIGCFASQFYDEKSKEPETFISKQDFMRTYVLRRAEEFGRLANAKYGEGFIGAAANESETFLL
ncbi:MAG: bacillithiol biosynthesis deacetylase BshB1 [Bacteroidota bacterium]